MLGNQLRALREGPGAGVDAALDVVAGVDDALVHGFGRLGDDATAALTRLASAVATTPLADRVTEAVGKVVAGSVGDEHLGAIAGARTAVLGAVHDALLAHVDESLGRARAHWPDPLVPTGVGAATAADNLLAGCRSWLRELAITGWHGVDHDLVSASSQILPGLWAEPRLRRLAVLLDGLVGELRASAPVATMPEVPVRRWADLWSRAVLLAQPGGAALGGPEASEPVTGRLLILGVDVHEHATAAQVQVHGVLEPSTGDTPRLVRTSVAVAKVDTIVGAAVWRLMDDYPVLLRALAEGLSIAVTDLELRAGGDLIWRESNATLGDPADPFTATRIQLGAALAPAVTPLDRHPVRIAEPVLLEAITTSVAADGAITCHVDGEDIALDVTRLPDCGSLTTDVVAAATACVGLLRWDAGQWTVQPLAVRMTAKRKTATVHNGLWAMGATDAKAKKAEALTTSAVQILRERAGRLLRR